MWRNTGGQFHWWNYIEYLTSGWYIFTKLTSCLLNLTFDRGSYSINTLPCIGQFNGIQLHLDVLLIGHTVPVLETDNVRLVTNNQTKMCCSYGKVGDESSAITSIKLNYTECSESGFVLVSLCWFMSEFSITEFKINWKTFQYHHHIYTFSLLKLWFYIQSSTSFQISNIELWSQNYSCSSARFDAGTFALLPLFAASVSHVPRCWHNNKGILKVYFEIVALKN